MSGELLAQQVLANRSRELGADAFDRSELLDAGRLDAGHAAEAREQRAPLLRTDARNRVHLRADLAALFAVIRDREAVRFVADALEQMTRGAVARELDRSSHAVRAGQEHT